MCDCKKDKSCCKDVVKSTKGERGKTGSTGVGQTGPIGLTGPQGLSGTNGTNGINGANGLPGEQGEPGPPGTGNAPLDSDWKELLGFSYYSGAQKPQCRRIGNVIYFRGTVVVPLATTAISPLVIDLLSFHTYENQPYPFTYTGATNGCMLPLAEPGLVLLNQGANMIPTSVITAATTLDGEYVKKNIIATRDINTGENTAVTLSTVVTIGMSTDKNLFIRTLEDMEFTNQRPSNTLQSSPLHFLSSNVRNTHYVPTYKLTAPTVLGTDTNLHSSLSTGTTDIKAPYATTYPFNVNLGNSKEIGGLQINLDGFHVFLAKCNTDSTPPVPCG